jgi:WxL Interacting Protein, host binding domain
MRTFLTFLACAAVAGVAAQSAVAAGPQAASFALNPVHYDPSVRASKSYFIVQAKPGDVVSNSVRVYNLGGVTGTAYLYAVDGTTGQTSGAVYLDRNRPRRGVGAWIALGEQKLALGPRANAVVPFVLRVPRDAKPGDHLGGIVAENAALTQSNSKGALQIKIRHLTIVAVEVQVPGTAPAGLRIGAVKAGGEHGYQYLYVHLKNTGAVSLKPTGTIRVADANGKQVAMRQLQLDTFLPGTAIDYPVLLPAKALSPGSYRATVELSYAPIALGYRRSAGSARTVHTTSAFTVSRQQYTTVFKGVAPVQAPAASASPSNKTSILPWLVAAVAAVAAVAGFALLALRRRSA